MKFLLILIYCLSSIYSFSQISKKDLQGDWYIKKQFFQYDTLTFSKSKDYCIGNDTCTWLIIHKKIFFFGTYVKLKNSRVLMLLSNETGEFKKTDLGKIMILENDRGEILQFKIINDSAIKHKNKLQLVHFDDLSEQKLYNHVDSLVYHVLKYDSTKVDSAYLKMISGNLSNPTIRIRDRYDQYPKPLLLINGFIQEDYEILKYIRMVEVISIDYISENTKAAELYGSRGINGVILLQVSSKRYKIISKKEDK